MYRRPEPARRERGLRRAGAIMVAPLPVGMARSYNQLKMLKGVCAHRAARDGFFSTTSSAAASQPKANCPHPATRGVGSV